MKLVADVKDFTHAHRGDKFESSCRVRVFLSEDEKQDAVVLYEETGKGRSVTNGAEDIATKVCDVYELNPRQTTFIEFYPKEQTKEEENFSKVVFDCDYEFTNPLFHLGERLELINPQWSFMTREEAERICGYKI